jgi:hypothetical protein
MSGISISTGDLGTGLPDISSQVQNSSVLSQMLTEFKGGNGTFILGNVLAVRTPYNRFGGIRFRISGMLSIAKIVQATKFMINGEFI